MSIDFWAGFASGLAAVIFAALAAFCVFTWQYLHSVDGIARIRQTWRGGEMA